MQTVRQDELWSFLLSRGKDPRLASQAYESIRPFLARLDGGTYDLISEEAFEPIAAGRIIASALNVKVTRLMLVSRRGLLTGNDSDRSLADRKYSGSSLADRLMDRYSEELAAGLRSAPRELLFKRLSESLVDHLRLLPGDGRGLDECDCFRRQLHSSVGETVYFFLGLAMAGRRRPVMVKLAPLVGLLLRAIPVGEPGSWIMLVD